DDVATRLDRAVLTAPWSGPDRERFVADWQTRLAPSVRGASRALVAASDRAGLDAEEQELASTDGGTLGTSAAAAAHAAREGRAGTGAIGGGLADAPGAGGPGCEPRAGRRLRRCGPRRRGAGAREHRRRHAGHVRGCGGARSARGPRGRVGAGRGAAAARPGG